MAYYSDDVLNEVFGENDIVDYVEQFVRLKKTGNDYIGLCPFHNEKSPSFHVSRDKQLFHCFGCGASGNLVQFVMRHEGLDFIEALKLLAQRAGIDLPEAGGNFSQKDRELKKKVYDINRLSAKFYYDMLTKSPEGKVALAYFKERAIENKTITNFGLGFAPDSYTAIYDYLKKKGYNDEELIESGIVINRDGKIYDKFRNRVIFPIIDLRGNVIGFGGRIMGQGVESNGFKLPKYLNSAETPVFNKGSNLYSLNLAKKNSPFSLILVEGYMDVISTYQAGVTNVVATLGTALTENQAKLLMKYCNEILICYDSDEAGQKATIRAIDIINGVGGRARVIKLKGAKDPDEYIKSYGVVNFKKAVDEAVASTQFRLDLIRTKYSLDSPEGKSLYISEATESLVSLHDAVVIDAYINQISKETGINRDSIYAELKKKTAIDNQTTEKREQQAMTRIKQETDTVVLDNTQSKKMIMIEKKLIFMMSLSKSNIEKVSSEIKEDDFVIPIHKTLVSKIYEAKGNNKLIEPSILANDFSGNELNYVSNIFYNFEEFKDEKETIDELIKNFKVEKIKDKVSKTKDAREISELFKELEKLKNS